MSRHVLPRVLAHDLADNSRTVWVAARCGERAVGAHLSLRNRLALLVNICGKVGDALCVLRLSRTDVIVLRRVLVEGADRVRAACAAAARALLVALAHGGATATAATAHLQRLCSTLFDYTTTYRDRNFQINQKQSTNSSSALRFIFPPPPLWAACPH